MLFGLIAKKEGKTYKYFDTPDGEDIFKKLWAIYKPTSLAALGISTCDVMLYSHPKGYLKTLGRFVYISGPILGITTTFVVATNLSASLRHKDDKLNWFIGGASAGAVLGACCKSGVGGSFAALGFGICALLKKYAVENNYTLFPTYYKPLEGSIWPHDFSLTRDRPGNWTTGEEKE